MIALIVLLAAGRPVSAQDLPVTPGAWAVAYDHLDSLFERGLTGSLEVRDGQLRYQAINRQVSWAIPLEDIYSIRIEETVSPMRVRVKSIVIESREGNSDVRRRIAPVDGELRFVPPVVLSALLKDRVKQFSEQRTLAARQR